MADIRELLNIKLESPYFDESYAKALATPDVPEWLTEGYIRALHEQCRALPKTLDQALEVLPHVVAVPELCLLAKVFYYMLATRKEYSEVFTALSFPEAPEGSEHVIGYESFAIFPVLAHVKASWDELIARGVGEAVATDSVLWTDNFFAEACKDNGKICYPKEYFAAYSVGIYVKTLIIGRLRFEPRASADRPVRIFRSTEGKYIPPHG